MGEMEDTNYKFNSQDIENIWYIFFCLADSTFSSVEVSYGKKGPYMLSGETMMSICKTLETIDFCCNRDAYSDAYTLLRKCRDDLMQYLFVLNVIQNKHGLTDEEAEKFTINSESVMKMIELDVSILISGERKTDAELAMEKWIYNVLESSENKEDRKQFFDTSKYKSYLVSNNEKVKYIFENFLVDKWMREDRQLNNYVHANGIRYTYQLAVASTSGFTACAQEFAATHRISLIEFDKLPFWNELMEILGEDKENVDIEEDKLKKIVKQISSHMAVAITNIGQLLFLCCQNGNEEVDFETNEYDISFKNKNESWTLKCGNKEYSFQLPEHIAESWIEYSEYEIKRKKEVIESTEKPVSNMIVYYRRNEKPVIKMLSIDEDKLQEARKKLDETTKKRES